MGAVEGVKKTGIRRLTRKRERRKGWKGRKGMEVKMKWVKGRESPNLRCWVTRESDEQCDNEEERRGKRRKKVIETVGNKRGTS